MANLKDLQLNYQEICKLSVKYQVAALLVIFLLIFLSFVYPELYEPRCEKTGLRGFRPGPA